MLVESGEAGVEEVASRPPGLMRPAALAVARRQSSKPRRRARARAFGLVQTAEHNFVEACITSEAECRLALAADSSYAQQTAPLSLTLRCLIACADACRRTVCAVIRGEHRLVDVSSWCAELGLALRDVAGAGHQWAAVIAAGEQCAAYCSDLCSARKPSPVAGLMLERPV